MTDRTEALDIEAIERRAEQATPGTSGKDKGPGWRVSQNRHPTTQGQPWGVVEASPHPALGAGTPPEGVHIEWRGARGRDNAEFIAHARSDIPALIQALKASNEERERVRVLVEKWRGKRMLEGRLKNRYLNGPAFADELEAALSHPISPERSDEGTEK